MTINERIKFLRKDKGWNQKQFASMLGVTQSGISYMEQKGSTISDSSIKVICSVAGVNENWLRNGIEPMYISSSFNLDEFCKNHGATELELNIMKAYFEFEPEVREMLLQHFKEHIIPQNEEKTTYEKNSKNKVLSESDLKNLTIEERVALYRAELEREEKVEGKSEVS